MSHASTTASFDRLTSIAATLFRTPAATVALKTPDGVSLLGGPGVCGPSIERRASFTDVALEMGTGGVLVVEDATQDHRFRDNPVVAGAPHIRFFAGAVITLKDGANVGTLCVVDVITRPRPDEAQLDALKVLAAMAADILDRDAEVSRQRDELSMLALAESMSGVGHWRLDVATQAVQWSDEVYRIHGVTRETFDPNYGDAVAFYHPDDQAEVRQQIQSVMETGEELQFELRLLARNGQERIVQSRASVDRDEHGRTTAVYGVFRDVSEERRALRQSKKNEERYRLLADNSADVIARLRADGSSRYISPAIEQLLGWRYEEMSGEAGEYVHPQDRSAVLATAQAALTSGEPRSISHRALHRDGRVIWVESRFKSFARDAGAPQEVLVTIRDITERKALEDRLQAALDQARESERRYRLLTDRAEDIIITYSYDSTVTYASPSVESVMGIRPDEIVGRSVNQLLHPEDRAGVIADLAAFIRDHPDQDLTTQSYRAIIKSGEVRHYETRTRIIRDDAGKVLEIHDVARDVTETRQMEADLREARDRAEAAAQAKSEFLANMSHELRTPLTSVVGFAGLLRDSGSLTPEDRRHVERISTGSEALLSVINDILDYSKLEAEALEMDVEPFHPWDLAHGAADLMETQRAAKGLDLTVEVDPSAPAMLLGDQGRLRQVTLNFLSNAMKFTSEGAVRLAVGGGEQPDGRWRLRVAVSDTGMGVEPDKLDTLFERFTQADQSTTRNFGGTGLGLAISKRLIAAMGGEIGADSTPGEGSTFWFEVPLTVTDAEDRAEEIEAVAPERTARILIADDAPANRELVMAILTQLGAVADAVADGAEAVEAVSTGFYDLVLMDMHMPVMDGLEATRRIRALDGDLGRLPIIALTANVQADQVKTCLDAGMDGHVGKPINVAELARAVASWLGRRHGDAAEEAAA
jgi:PAS domain S-box-containing protein